MSWYSKVAWTEGLFLQPHHLQQADRYLEQMVRQRTRAASPHAWGFETLQLDRNLLQQGRVGLTAMAGIFADGTPFEAPAAAALPLPVAVPEAGAGLHVWLTLPDQAANGREYAAPDEGGAATRYVTDVETIADGSTAMRQEAQIAIARPRLELDIRATPKPGHQCLRLARITEVRDRVVTLDETFAPPLLLIAAHPTPTGWLDRVIGWVETRLEMLARYAADPSSGGGLQEADFLLLISLNRRIGPLQHLRRSGVVHPVRLYEELLSLAGELASFDHDRRRAADYPAYDHQDTKGCIEPLLRDIQRLLAREIGRALRLELREIRPNSYLAQITDRSLFSEASFVLEVESQRPLGDVQRQFPELCKVGPNTRMADIVGNNLYGIGLQHLPTPPRQIRAVSSNVYFLLDRNTPLWREFSNAPAIGLHFAGDWPGLKLDLWAILETRR